MAKQEHSSSIFEDAKSQGYIPSGQDPSYCQIKGDGSCEERTSKGVNDHQGDSETGNNDPHGCGRFSIQFLSMFVPIFVIVFLSSSVTADSYQHLESKTVHYMKTFGYVPDYTIETQNLMSQEDFVRALKRLQAWAGLPQTGYIDHRTEEQMNKPRCGVKDRTFDDFGRRRRKRYILARSKWKKKDLTFRYVIEQARMSKHRGMGYWGPQGEIEKGLRAIFKKGLYYNYLYVKSH